MDLRRVRRLSSVLVASQVRSGQSSSDPTSWTSHPGIIGAVDLALFAVAVVLGEVVVRSPFLPAGVIGPLVDLLLPFVPLVAVGGVLVAGVMFELTTTQKFSGSDAANWLPIDPTEYVAASATALAYTYSIAVAVVLGAVLPFALVAGQGAAYALTVVLGVLALFEGAFLVEMVRSVTQRVGAVSAGHRGRATFLLRAALLLVLILAFQVAFNPVVFLAFVRAFGQIGLLAVVVPVLWPTQTLTEWVAGSSVLASAFAAASIAFVVVLAFAAARLRARYWVVADDEVHLDAIAYAEGHPLLRAFGLSPREAALASKDLRGLVRRRELLPLLLVPVVLVVIVSIEARGLGVLSGSVTVGFVAGLYALLLGGTAVGQERRGLQSLFALPISPRELFRAKLVAVLLPVAIGAVGMALVVGVVARFSPLIVVGFVVLVLAVAVVLALWGLAFAARYSDFQERPRPQFLRPLAMVAAMVSGSVLSGLIVVPGGLALAAARGTGGVDAIGAVVLALLVGAGAGVWARSGFDRLILELPF